MVMVATVTTVTTVFMVVRGIDNVLLDGKIETIARVRDNNSKVNVKQPTKDNLDTKAMPVNVGSSKDEHAVSLNVTEVGSGVFDTVQTEHHVTFEHVTKGVPKDSIDNGVGKPKDPHMLGMRSLANHVGGTHGSFTDLGFTVPPHDKEAPDKVGTDELFVIRDEPHEDVKKTCVAGLHTINDFGDVGPPNVTARQVGGYFHLMLKDGKIAIANSIGDFGARKPIKSRQKTTDEDSTEMKIKGISDDRHCVAGLGEPVGATIVVRVFGTPSNQVLEGVGKRCTVQTFVRLVGGYEALESGGSLSVTSLLLKKVDVVHKPTVHVSYNKDVATLRADQGGPFVDSELTKNDKPSNQIITANIKGEIAEHPGGQKPNVAPVEVVKNAAIGPEPSLHDAHVCSTPIDIAGVVHTGQGMSTDGAKVRQVKSAEQGRSQGPIAKEGQECKIRLELRMRWVRLVR